jgi:multiple sugar transport system substrate-binding protein
VVSRFRPVLALLGALVAVASTGCGGGSAPSEDRTTDPEGARRTLTMWILENQPDRMRAARRTLAAFTKASGYEVELVGIGDNELDARLSQAVRSGRGPDVVQLPMANAHAYARAGTLSTDAAQEVVDRLGEETFSARALSLLTSEGQVIAVPSDGWGQLLIYRRDLFDRAGLDEPETLDDVRRAARALDRPGRAGITLSTTVSPFTAETFEHVALASDCQLLDDRGRVTLTSPACRRAFAAYADLASHSPGGRQDVDSTRDAYFAGRAAMVLWSPFLLDAMAGLRDDARPTCPECRDDPAYLARNSGLVGPLSTPRGERAQFGTISTWGILADGDLIGARRLVEFMMSGGYEGWLAISPQGKYPVRLGDRTAPERFVEGWSELLSGVDRKAPLSRFYSQASLASVGEGARSFRRWGFEQGEASLIGALAGPQPVAKALVTTVRGPATPAQAALQAKTTVELLQGSLR